MDYPSPNDVVMRPTYKMLIIFIVGGCTYQESAFVETINKGSATASAQQASMRDEQTKRQRALTVVRVFVRLVSPSGVRIVLGGSTIHNSTSSA